MAFLLKSLDIAIIELVGESRISWATFYNILSGVFSEWLG